MAQTEQIVPAAWEAGYVQLKSICDLTLAKVNRLEEQMSEALLILRTKLS